MLRIERRDFRWRRGILSIAGRLLIFLRAGLEAWNDEVKDTRDERKESPMHENVESLTYVGIERHGRFKLINAFRQGYLYVKALASGQRDFEDEMQIARASSQPGLTAIITRNLADYGRSALPALAADTWLQQHPRSPLEVSS